MVAPRGSQLNVEQHNVSRAVLGPVQNQTSLGGQRAQFVGGLLRIWKQSHFSSDAMPSHKGLGFGTRKILSDKVAAVVIVWCELCHKKT